MSGRDILAGIAVASVLGGCSSNCPCEETSRGDVTNVYVEYENANDIGDEDVLPTVTTEYDTDGDGDGDTNVTTDYNTTEDDDEDDSEDDTEDDCCGCD